MADVKISALPSATTPLAGTEVLPIVQSATTDQVSVANLTAGRSVSAASLTLTTTPLAVGSGGTGLTSLTSGYIPYGNGTAAFSSSNALFFSGSNLGIGTSGPGAKLDVSGGFIQVTDTTGSGGYRMRFGVGGPSGSPANLAYIEARDSLPLGFYTSSIEYMRITNAGNVGIGTTSPSQKLSIQQSTNGSLAGMGLSVYKNGDDSSLVLGYRSDIASGSFVIGPSYDTTGAYYPLVFRTSDTIRMILDTSGNVGIGTTMPASILHVNSTAAIVRPYVTATTGYVDWQVSSTGGNFYFGIDNSAGGISGTAYGRHLYSDGAYPLDFFTNSSNRMRIDSSGNLLVGTTTASTLLTVNGIATLCSGTATPAGGSTSARLIFGTTSGFGIYYGSGAPTVSAAQGSIYLRSDGSSTSTRLYVNTNGSTTWTNVTTAA